MTVTPISFGIQSNPGRYGLDGTGLLTNCYVEAKGNDAKTPTAIYPHHGLTLFSNVATANGTRGLKVMDKELYWVIGRQLRKVDTVGNNSLIGGVADDGPVSMASNTKSPSSQLAIATKNGLRYIVEDDVASIIADTDLPPPIAVEYLGGYIIYLLPDGRMYYSAINEAGDINGLDFFEAETNPDGGKELRVLGNVLYVFGDETVEPFRNTGGTSNPFTAILGGTVTKGCIAGGTVQEFDNTLIWVSDRKTVLMGHGGRAPQSIGTNYVNDLIRKEASPENMTGDVYSMQGHEFYVLSGTNFTVMYDAATGSWTDKVSSGMTRWRGQTIVAFADKWIVGDNSNGNLYYLDPTAFDENGNDMVMRMRSPLINATPNRLRYKRLWLDFVTGQGLNTTDTHNATPQLALRYSDDGGFSWSNERTRSLGKIGDRLARVKFKGLGTEKHKGRTFEWSVSANVARCFMQAHADVSAVKG